MCAQPLLQVKNLSVSLNRNRVSFLAVDSLSFDVFPGQTLAIIGESGSGKSITAQSLMQLLPEENFSLSGEALLIKRISSIVRIQMRKSCLDQKSL